MVMWLQTRWNFRNSHPDTPTTFTTVAHCTGRRRAKKKHCTEMSRRIQTWNLWSCGWKCFSVTLPGRFARLFGQNLVWIQFVWMSIWDTRGWGFKAFFSPCRQWNRLSSENFQAHMWSRNSSPALIIKLKNWRLWYSPNFIAHQSQMLSIYFLYFCLLSLDDSRVEVIRH